MNDPGSAPSGPGTRPRTLNKGISMRRLQVCVLVFVILFTAVMATAVVDAPAATAGTQSATGITADEIAEIIAGNADKFEDADAVIVFDRISTVYKENGAAITEEEVLIHFREEAGGTGYRSLHYDYNPRTAVVRFLEVKVFRAGGGTEDPLAEDAVFTDKAPAYSIFWNFDVTVCPLPRLEKGDALYYRIERRGLNLAYLGGDAGSATGAAAQGAAGDGKALAASGTAAGVMRRVAADGSGMRVPIGSEAAGGVTASAASDASNAAAERSAPVDSMGEEGDFIPPHRGYFMDTLFFEGELPIIEKTYRIRGPRSRPLQFATANGGLAASTRFSDEEWFYEFAVKDRPAFNREPNDDGFNESALKLAVAAHPSWEMKSKWAYEHNEPQFVISPELQAEVDGLIEGCADDNDRMFRLLHWVADEIRYLGLDMGEGEGHMVHRTDEIFSDRSGVCKDKAAVLVSMLRAAGFETYFVMTLAMEQTLDIPADDKFNHGVVAVRRDDGGWTFLDPTWAPSNRPLFNYLEQEQPVLVACPEGTGLKHVPYSPPEESPLRVTARTTLDADGNARSDLFFETDGFYDGLIRSRLSSLDEKSRESFIRGILDDIAPRVELVEFGFSDPRDYYQPMEFRIVAEFPGAAVKADGDLYFSPILSRHPFGGRYEADYLFLSPGEEKRAHAAELACTRLVEFSETVRFPRGFNLEPVPDSVSCESPTMDLEFSVTSTGRNSCRIEHVMRIKKRVTPASEFIALAEVSEKAVGLRDLKLALKRDGKRIRNPKSFRKGRKVAEGAGTLPPYGARVKSHKITLVLENNGTMTERYHTVAVVYDAAGRDHYADRLFTIHTGIQDYRVTELYTMTPDGRKIESPPEAINLTLGDIVIDAPDYRDIHTLAASLTGVEFGSTLVSTIDRQTTILESDGPGNMEYLFQPADYYPVDKAEFCVDMPAEMTLNYDLLGFSDAPRPEVKMREGRKTYTWEFNDIPPYAVENHSGPYYMMQPVVVVSASPTPGWEARLAEIGVGFFDYDYPVEDGEVIEAVAAKADAITSDAASPLEKIDALTGYVSGRIGSFYTHPRRFLYRMRPVERILSTGYGHSLDRMKLLAALAESLGWSFELGLAGPTERVSDRVACMRSLPDMFAVVTIEGEKLFACLDDPGFSFFDLAGKSVFTVGRDGVRRLETPSPGLDGNSCVMDLKLKLDGDGGVTGNLDLSYRGVFNPFRDARIDTEEWVKSAIPGIVSEPVVKSMHILRLSDGSEGSRFFCAFEGKIELESLDECRDILQVPSCPGGFTGRGYDFSSDPKRRNPLYLGSGGSETCRIEMEFPEEWTIDYRPSDSLVESQSAWFERKVEEAVDDEEKCIVIDRRFEIVQPVIPASEYGTFLEAWLAFRLDQENRIVFNKIERSTADID